MTDEDLSLIKLLLKPIKPYKQLIRGAFSGLTLNDYLLGRLPSPPSEWACACFMFLTVLTMALLWQSLFGPRSPKEATASEPSPASEPSDASLAIGNPSRIAVRCPSQTRTHQQVKPLNSTRQNDFSPAILRDLPRPRKTNPCPNESIMVREFPQESDMPKSRFALNPIPTRDRAVRASMASFSPSPRLTKGQAGQGSGMRIFSPLPREFQPTPAFSAIRSRRLSGSSQGSSPPRHSSFQTLTLWLNHQLLNLLMPFRLILS